MTSPWAPENVLAMRIMPCMRTTPVPKCARILSEMDLWDYWPLLTDNGAVADVFGGTLYFFLSAPILPDPESRHAVARLRLVYQLDGQWHDLGYVFPESFSPGSREWAGSCIIKGDRVTVYFTAAGRSGEAALSFEQRLFECQAWLVHANSGPQLIDWSAPVESVKADGYHYVTDMRGAGTIGTIKAFRDPAYFRDPATGRAYLLFAGSLASSSHAFNGCIGIAVQGPEQWSLLPPLVHADGLNNELERPHIVYHDNRYYLFWSTQAKVFAPDIPKGPTGLYGMVADQMEGPWSPLNESGLVLTNPEEYPYQAFSWLVLSDLRVLSFLDVVGLGTMPESVTQARRHFGGTPAPEVTLKIEGARVWIA